MTKERKRKSRFVSNVTVWRAINQMTQQELADEVAVTQQTISLLEKNRYNPRLILAWNIADVFGVPIDQVFTFYPLEESEEEDGNEE